MRKLLIANRGEIACRIIRTARAMNIATVAVYSEADANAPHVRLADEAIAIGPAPAAESYLLADRIIAAARATGADAVHPGYGFLSENAGFARALAEAGLIFVGPPASAIDKMGLKDAAKELMKEAGVPVTPGYQGADQSLARFQKAADVTGYPLLIKAVAGGGGKGMRRVDRPDELADALAAAQREGAASFGNADVLVEKLIGRPRHVEVQVFGDTHGNVVHLFERDCSAQRRHQKVIEEAPAPDLSAETRAALGQAAVRAAQAIGYVGAGTIEFILDTEDEDDTGNNRFYFMEMNTRLQVEHPVTELVTGTDLVEWQIRVARGEKLPLPQSEIRVRGHAVEARLYAEDPESGFLPSIGALNRLRFPAEQDGVRIDSGVEQGGEVSIHYDPMIAKVIAWGPDRNAAVDALVTALDETVVEGVRTNRAFLARLANSEPFRAGAVHTGMIGDALDALTGSAEPSPAMIALAAYAVAHPRPPAQAATLFARFPDWRLNLPARRYVTFHPLEGDPVRVEVVRGAADVVVEGLGEPLDLQLRWRDDGWLGGRVGGAALSAFVVTGDDWIELRSAAQTYRFQLLARRGEAKAGDGTVVAAMPGRITALLVEEGQQVGAGDKLVILEAMKMENALTAAVAGTVTGLDAAVGDQVAEGHVLLTIEPAA